jgi:osmoprotectant transport system substrate-binding protein
MEADGFPRPSVVRPRTSRVRRAGPRIGLVEFVPEYAGTALQFATLDERVPVTAIGRTHDALRRTFTSRDVTVLDAAPAQGSNAFVVRREVAERYDLHRISDLAGVAPVASFAIGVTS